MKCKIIVVGKLKDQFTKEWVHEYAKRLPKYCAFEVIELKEQATLEQEKELVLHAIPDNTVVVAFAIHGKQLSSEGFADWISKQTGTVVLIIGSDKGIHQDVLKRANLLVSFGLMTFPHNIARLLVTEQLYRAFSILKHEPYHK